MHYVEHWIFWPLISKIRGRKRAMYGWDGTPFRYGAQDKHY